MREIICKIWRFLSDMLGLVVDFIAGALTTIGTAVVDVLSDLLQAAGSAIGDIFSTNPLLWMGVIGVGLWWLFSDNEEKQQQSTQKQPQTTQKQPQPTQTQGVS